MPWGSIKEDTAVNGENYYEGSSSLVRPSTLGRLAFYLTELGHFFDPNAALKARTAGVPLVESTIRDTHGGTPVRIAREFDRRGRLVGVGLGRADQRPEEFKEKDRFALQALSDEAALRLCAVIAGLDGTQVCDDNCAYGQPAGAVPPARARHVLAVKSGPMELTNEGEWRKIPLDRETN